MSSGTLGPGAGPWSGWLTTASSTALQQTGSCPVPQEIARAALLRAGTVDVAAPWPEMDARIGADATALAPGTFARWPGGCAEVLSVRPAGPRLDRTTVAFWLLAGSPGATADDAAAHWAQRVAWLQGVGA